MPLPRDFLEASTWAPLPVDIIHVRYGAEKLEPQGLEPETAYRPIRDIPKQVVYRTSDREKRLEVSLSEALVTSGPWGELHEITGGGSHIGFVILLKPNAFCGAHLLPDSAHLISYAELLPDTCIIKDIHDHKMFRLFKIGPAGNDDSPHDVIVTTKTRWFRNRNNPKFLGFSKDER